MRGLSLLKVGGLLSYSTCSLNPMEDEAVVATLLERCRGCVEVVDCRGKLPAFATRPGMTSWQVLSDSLVPLPSYAAARSLALLGVRRWPRGGHCGVWHHASSARPLPCLPGTMMPHASATARAHEWICLAGDLADVCCEDRQSLGAKERKRYRGSMWPPTATHITHGLRRCQRLLPHLNNTGGFFVAILRKTRALPGAEGVQGPQKAEDALAARPPRPVPRAGQSRPVLWRLSAQEASSLLALATTRCRPGLRRQALHARPSAHDAENS